jgi:DNA-binding LacI/PurR family transcriptional regulator
LQAIAVNRLQASASGETPLNNRTVTIRDVARLVGVSESTVSRVLSGVETQIPISEETRVQVQHAARQLGYRPHPSARALSGKGSLLLGLIVREISDPWFACMIEVISSTAKERGFDLVLGNAKRDPEEALALRDTMLDLRYCDGLLLCGDLQESAEDQTFLDKMGQSHRLVSISRGSRELACNIPYVGVDNRAGVLLALNHLAGLGHRQIACISAGRVGDLWDRVQAYSDFMRMRFGDVSGGCVELDQNSYEGGYQVARRLFSLLSPPTAIFATDDRLAIGAMCALLDTGYAVPTEVSIVGFDDMDFAAYSRPALTTVHQPTEEIGQRAVELVLQMIEGLAPGTGPCPQLMIEPTLVIRDSTGSPRLVQGGNDE